MANKLEYGAVGKQSWIYIDLDQPQLHVFVKHDVETKQIEKSNPAIQLVL